jgi:hypothetical protein
MHVLVLPPSESYSNLVNLESLYGICELFPSTKQVMTFIKADRDKFILVASLNLWPVDPVFFYFSDPARSTRLSFPILIFYLLF